MSGVAKVTGEWETGSRYDGPVKSKTSTKHIEESVDVADVQVRSGFIRCVRDKDVLWLPVSRIAGLRSDHNGSDVVVVVAGGHNYGGDVETGHGVPSELFVEDASPEDILDAMEANDE